MIKTRKKYKRKFKLKNISQISFFDILFFFIKSVFIVLLILILIIFSKRKVKASPIIPPKNIIHLSINIDDNYIYPSIVYLTSLLDNMKNSTFYTIHILSNNNLTNSSIDKINKVINKFEQLVV